ncbi:hypothetical protein PAXINDRAFT_102316 [Paxillus involutus ATCC 200175]|uniref:Uncharacterized protein n=1 Tax=Paxillus involutus ATCC 200175 TaxID=664439 RepID=A0A0C9SPS7_PAXIN|nr:hypothetical protein PAXINDRAFT_102316 [Paxillus involutus ATCC 200175]
MGLVIGGYILEVNQAKEWADKRFPNKIQWGVNNLVARDINIYLNDVYNPKKDTMMCDMCIVVLWERDGRRVCFPTVSYRRRSCTRRNHPTFQENENAISLKKEYFEDSEDFAAEELTFLKEIPFVTIYDPFRSEYSRV